ncbi:MAG: sodium:calcium antiporter, partial [Actinomycetota bacterium]
MYIFWLIIGVALAAVGGDRFVRGVVEMSAALRIPPGIIGATIAAFATSSPEMVVAVLAATDGAPELALGDALGSNMANLGLVLGVTVLLAKVTARWADIRRDLPAALLTLGLLALLVIDGDINRVDAVVMFAVFASWLTWVTVDARREASAVEVLEDEGPRHFIRDVVT